MTRISKTSLLLGVAVLALSACGGSKGPGALGTKDDIVVRNNGLPGATAPVPPSAEGEIAQAESAPTPEVAGAPLEMPGESEPLPNTDPAVEQAAQQVEESRAPAAPTTAAPMSDATTASTAPATQTVPADVVAPEPVTQTTAVEPPPAEAAAAPANTVPASTAMATPDNTYVPSDAPASAISALNARRINEQSAVAPATTPASAPAAAPAVAEPVVQAPVEVPVGEPVTPPTPAAAPSSVYPAEDYPAQAPVQAQAQIQAPVAAAAPAVPATTPAINFADPQVVKTVQAALKIKGVYTGKEDGVVNTQYLNALSKYQGDNKLPQGGLNIETLRHLGVVQ